MPRAVPSSGYCPRRLPAGRSAIPVRAPGAASSAPDASVVVLHSRHGETKDAWASPVAILTTRIDVDGATLPF